MEQLTRSPTFNGPLVALIQAPAEDTCSLTEGVSRPAPLWLYSEFGADYK